MSGLCPICDCLLPHVHMCSRGRVSVCLSTLFARSGNSQGLVIHSAGRSGGKPVGGQQSTEVA